MTTKSNVFTKPKKKKPHYTCEAWVIRLVLIKDIMLCYWVIKFLLKKNVEGIINFFKTNWHGNKCDWPCMNNIINNYFVVCLKKTKLKLHHVYKLNSK